MKIRIAIFSLLFAVPLITFAQGINNYKLKIPDKAGQLFSQVKGDSNYIEYVQLMGEHVKSFEKNDSMNTKAGKINGSFPPKAIQILNNLRKTYPLLKQLNNKEESNFARLSAKYFNQLMGQSSDNAYPLFKAFNTLMRLMVLSSKEQAWKYRFISIDSKNP